MSGIICIILTVLAFLAIYLALPGGKLWNQYLTEVKDSLAALDAELESRSKFTLDRISELPDLLQKHIINGGYIGNYMVNNMLIHFHDAKFRMSAGKKPIRIQFLQINFVKRPDRHAFLSGRIAGVPLQAKDSISDGFGSMTGALAKRFQIFHSTGDEMNQSQLITTLADAVYMPSLFLQKYVSWNVIDDHTIEGEITWKDVSAKGSFTFDDNGNIVRFFTNDRYLDENGRGSSLVPWYVTYSHYRKQNGYVQPGAVEVSWALPEGSNTYFVSDQIEIQYEIKIKV